MFYGWDVSTAIIGHAAFDDKCQLVETRCCDLRDIEGLNEKADVARQFVHDVWARTCEEDISDAVHFVEDRLAGFSGGGSNAGTVMRLASFNAMVCWMIHTTWKKDGGSIFMLHPSTVKATMRHEGLVVPKGGDKKELTLEWVSKRDKKFPPIERTKVTKRGGGNPQPWFYDMADAYVTAVVGYRKHILTEVLRKAGCDAK